ncbi:YetF domain-containing protein [Clostridium pasteurianum]|uniref:Putative membrane protein n=1 Tax=Clostridium pasteurianum BC1 TaxID=86416 RepID=R4K381_CLOPA|nr:DUF421 domain-containing protein [Clostridium pasteurianum]AGK97572.1 putative membrane protein [Clostridium pasteurianum BC1]
MFEPLNIVLRVFSALIFLFAATKFLNKRSLSNLTYFDYIAATILGTIAGNLAFNVKIHILNFILSIILVTLIISLVSYFSLKYKSFRKFFAGESTILIKNGKILKENLTSLNYSYDYLNQQLRQEKVFDICQVEFAILETSGKLSVQLKPQNCPLTSQSLYLSTKHENLAIELVLEGKVIEKNLKQNSLTQQWLYKELKKKGIENIKEVAFAALSTNGNFYVNLYHD